MSDLKYLPPKDCWVYVTNELTGNHWVHALYLRRDQTWHSAETTLAIDPSRVITWRELPEVE